MYDYHNAFDRVKKIIRGENGELPTFWLELFRQWLSGEKVDTIFCSFILIIVFRFTYHNYIPLLACLLSF